MRKTDEEFLQLFQSNSESAMEQLVQQYTGLVHTIVAEHLDNPEDVKECVNEVFAEFYFHKERFDARKGTLANYLSGIAHNRAISFYRKMEEGKGITPLPLFEGIVSDDQELLDLAEWKTLLDQAMTVLTPEEVAIIRMKYYQGMPVKEIAKELNLPYETTKKKHQRSLGKLRRTIFMLIILAILGLLAACGYFILRYYGIVLGYGINEDPTSAVYALEGWVEGEYDDYKFIVENAVLINDKLVIDIEQTKVDPENEEDSEEEAETPPESEPVVTEPEPFTPPDITIEHMDESYHVGSSHTTGPTSDHLQIVVDNVTMPELEDEKHDITVNVNGTDIDVTLDKKEEEPVEDFEHEIDKKEEEGVLAVPRMENEELVIGIYPLNSDNKQVKVMPALIYSLYASPSAPNAPTVTLTDQAGTIYPGKCVNFNPMSPAEYFDWNFGDLPAGDYTLHIPFLLEKVKLPDDLSIPLDLKNGVDTTTVYDCGAFTMQIVGCEQVTAANIPQLEGEVIYRDDSNYYWVLTTEILFKDENRTVVAMSTDMEAVLTNYPWLSVNQSGLPCHEPNRTRELIYIFKDDIAKEGEIPLVHITSSDGMIGPYMIRQWNRSFDIPITVE